MITDQTRILFSNLSRSNLSNFSLFLSSFFFSFLYRFQFYFCIFPQPLYIWERERTKMGKGKHFLLFFIAKVVFVRYKKSACFFSVFDSVFPIGDRNTHKMIWNCLVVCWATQYDVNIEFQCWEKEEVYLEIYHTLNWIRFHATNNIGFSHRCGCGTWAWHLK